MAHGNVTPISPAAITTPKSGPKEIAQALGQIRKKVHAFFCPLKCESAGLEKAETEGNSDL